MRWIFLFLKCLALASLTGLVMMQLPPGRLTDTVGTLTWVGLCVVLIRRELRRRAEDS